MSNIKKNFAYNSLLTVAGYIFPLLTFPYVTRVLGVSNIGLVNFIDSVITYAMLFSALGVGVAGIRAIASSSKDYEERNRVFSSLLTLTIITTIIALVALIVMTITIRDLRENVELVGIGMVKLVFNTFLIEWFYRGIEDFKYITIRSLLVKVLYVVAIFIFVRQSDDFVAYYAISNGAIVINAIINLLYSRKFVRFSFRGIELKKYLKPFISMGVYLILVSTYSTLNVAILGFVTNDTQVGYYTTAVKLYAIILALFTAFTNVMLPRLSSLRSEGKMEEFSRMITISIRIVVLFSIPLIVFSEIYAPEIIGIIAGNGYEDAILPMRIVMLLVFVVGSNQVLVMQILMPFNDDNTLVRNTAMTAVASLILNALLVASLKSIGSAIVIVCSEIILMILSVNSSKKLLVFKYPFAFMLKNIAVFLPMCPILYIIKQLVSEMFISIAIGGCVMLGYSVIILMTVFKREYLTVEIKRSYLNKYNRIKK